MHYQLTTKACRLATGILVAALCLFYTSPASADGTETLGAPSIVIAPGTGIVAAGTGLLTQPGAININVPGNVVQVLAYWECQEFGNIAGDNSIDIDGNAVAGTLIGGQTLFFGPSVHSSAYRADITGLGIIGPGANGPISVDGLDCSRANNGAGILVIYDDGSGVNHIDLRDGLDLAFDGFPEPRKSTVPQTYNFAASGVDRVADLTMFFSSIQGDASGVPPPRPHKIVVTVGAVVTEFVDVLSSADGEEWDTFTASVNVAAGETSLTVEAVSFDDPTDNLPASFAWIAGGLTLPQDPGCTLTQGYWKTHSEFGPAPHDTNWDNIVGLTPGGVAATGADVEFLDTGLSYFEVLWTEPKGGNAFFILAHQYIAARLNQLAGAAVPPNVATALGNSLALLTAYEGALNIPKGTSDRANALNMAGLLDDYNNGVIGPGHCDDNVGKIGPDAETPVTATLVGAYPNPFNPSTTITFETYESTQVALSVFDVSGREIRQLTQGVVGAGLHEVTFDAAGLPSGVYFYRLEAEGVVQAKSFVLLR